MPLVQNIMHCWAHVNEEVGEFPGSSSSLKFRFAFDVLIAATSQTDIFEIQNQRKNGLFVIKHMPPKIPVFYLGFKESEFEKRLNECFLHPKSRGNAVFGAVTNVNTWKFGVYDGNQFIHSDPFSITSPTDKKGIEEVFNTMFRIVNHQEEIMKTV
jgi:hypothetical protein